MEGAVCSPRFGCEAGRRPEGGRRRSSGQTGSGLGRRLSGRRSRSGGLRKAVQAQAVRRAVNAVWPEAPTRERCAASSSEARRWGRHGSVVDRNPFPLLCPTTTAAEWATALGGHGWLGLSGN